jgi:transketolase
MLTARVADAIRFPALGAIARAVDGDPGAPPGCAGIAVAVPKARIR